MSVNIPNTAEMAQGMQNAPPMSDSYQLQQMMANTTSAPQLQQMMANTTSTPQLQQMMANTTSAPQLQQMMANTTSAPQLQQMMANTTSAPQNLNFVSTFPPLATSPQMWNPAFFPVAMNSMYGVGDAYGCIDPLAANGQASFMDGAPNAVYGQFQAPFMETELQTPSLGLNAAAAFIPVASQHQMGMTPTPFEMGIPARFEMGMTAPFEMGMPARFEMGMPARFEMASRTSQPKPKPKPAARKPKQKRATKSTRAAKPRNRSNSNSNNALADMPGMDKLVNRLGDVAHGATLPPDVSRNVDMTPRPQPKHQAADFLNDPPAVQIAHQPVHQPPRLPSASAEEFIPLVAPAEVSSEEHTNPQSNASGQQAPPLTKNEKYLLQAERDGIIPPPSKRRVVRVERNDPRLQRDENGEPITPPSDRYSIFYVAPPDEHEKGFNNDLIDHMMGVFQNEKEAANRDSTTLKIGAPSEVGDSCGPLTFQSALETIYNDTADCDNSLVEATLAEPAEPQQDQQMRKVSDGLSQDLMEQPLPVTAEENEEFGRLFEALQAYNHQDEYNSSALLGASESSTTSPASTETHIGAYETPESELASGSSSDKSSSGVEDLSDLSTDTTITTTATTATTTGGAQKRKVTEDDIAVANKKARTEF
ncbi:hypothetical protein FPOA_06210 [Fusarium poae]|uniref:Uncharacterized protein n=1 Tax=Fusarium poae TaxID=36050 RepID=A0A1B8AZ45_FUSPO|nr:hypothetical protein FPOA_06210 [Fusarium poae]